jgi:hypothetical protein
MIPPIERRYAMKRYTRLLLLLALVSIPVAAVLARGAGVGRKPVQFSEARLIIEFNATAEDVGVQAFIDGEPWKSLTITSPTGDTMLEVTGRGQLNFLGLTELFFESHEPALEDLTLEQFLALFPEGDYRLSGLTAGGQPIQATATFTHAIPPGPVIESPENGETVDPTNAVVRWEPVVAPGIEIVAYEVIIESGRFNHLDIHVPASVTELSVPPEFLQPNTDYLFEVLAIEAGGNQTITEGFFSTPK